MSNPSVSVIITCFNSEKFLEKTLNSIFAQTYNIDEIIVLNDGSIDNTDKILHKYIDKLTILYHDGGCNRGQAESLNKAILHAKSELIAFMDHDDLWNENKISEQVNVFIKHKDVGVCYTNGFVINECGRKIYSIIPDGFEEKNNPELLLLNCYIRTPSLVMARRSLFDSVGLFSNLLRTPDHDMWIRMIERTKFYFLDQKLVGYRQHSSQMSVSHSKEMWEGGFIVLQNAVLRYPYSKSIHKRRMAVLYYRLAMCDFHQKKCFSCLNKFLFAFLNDPFRSIRCFFTIMNFKFSR